MKRIHGYDSVLDNKDALNAAKENAIVYDDLPEDLFLIYKERYDKLKPEDLDEHMYSFVKSFDIFNGIVPVFSCSGHNKRDLNISFAIKEGGDLILRKLFNRFTKLEKVRTINSRYSIAYKYSAYDTNSKKRNFRNPNSRFVIYPLHTISLIYDKGENISELICDLERTVKTF